MTTDTLIFAQSMFHEHFLHFFPSKKKKKKCLLQEPICRHSLKPKSCSEGFLRKPQTLRVAAAGVLVVVLVVVLVDITSDIDDLITLSRGRRLGVSVTR